MCQIDLDASFERFVLKLTTLRPGQKWSQKYHIMLHQHMRIVKSKFKFLMHKFSKGLHKGVHKNKKKLVILPYPYSQNLF